MPLSSGYDHPPRHADCWQTLRTSEDVQLRLRFRAVLGHCVARRDVHANVACDVISCGCGYIHISLVPPRLAEDVTALVPVFPPGTRARKRFWRPISAKLSGRPFFGVTVFAPSRFSGFSGSLRSIRRGPAAGMPWLNCLQDGGARSAELLASRLVGTFCDVGRYFSDVLRVSLWTRTLRPLLQLC